MLAELCKHGQLLPQVLVEPQKRIYFFNGRHDENLFASGGKQQRSRFEAYRSFDHFFED